jgi:hypothetical protein
MHVIFGGPQLNTYKYRMTIQISINRSKFSMLCILNFNGCIKSTYTYMHVKCFAITNIADFSYPPISAQIGLYSKRKYLLYKRLFGQHQLASVTNRFKDISCLLSFSYGNRSFHNLTFPSLVLQNKPDLSFLGFPNNTLRFYYPEFNRFVRNDIMSPDACTQI